MMSSSSRLKLSKKRDRELTLSTLFISDLHLDPSRPAINRLFLDFLAQQAGSAEALYILGDLFDVWIGDDDDNRLAQQVAAALQTLAKTGVDVYFIHGNRDFTLGHDYASRCNMTLLAESSLIDLYGTPTLIMHGDTLCTDDDAYQTYRRRVRSPQWQRRILRLPLFARRLMAWHLRLRSRRAIRRKSAVIMDVNHDTVCAAMREAGAKRLIHGHTHRPAVHKLHIDGDKAERIVLGDWYTQGSVLRCDNATCRLDTLTP